MAETHQLKGQLVKAGTEAGAAGAVAMRESFKASGVFNDLGNALGASLNVAGGPAGRSLDVLTTRFGKLKDAITGASSGAGKAMQAFNIAGVAAVAGLGAAFIETTKKAGDFQASQERLVASAGETKAGMDAVSNGILQLAGQVGYSAQQLSDAMYTVEKAGYRGADGVNVLKAAAEGAKSENAELKEVLSGVTTTLSDFGLGAQAAPDIMSKMVAATGMAKTSFQEFAGALHSVEPIAGAVGQSLDAVGKQHLLADVYGSLAQLTQSGMSAAQAGQNMGRAFTTLSSPTQKMRDELGQLGLNAEDISQHLGERGLSGTLQMISEKIKSQMNPAGQVMIDTFLKSEQVAGAAKKEFDALPPAAHAVAQSIKDGTLSFKEFRKSRGGLSVEDANLVQSWNNLNNKVTGFSTALKTGQGDIQTYMQALAAATGNQETARAAALLTGEATQGLNSNIQTINSTYREADGTVKGFHETQSTLNAKMADATAAFGAAKIEIGYSFIPVMTDVANIAKNVGDAMAKHPAIVQGVVKAVEGLAAAWLAVKAVNIVGSVLTPAATGLAAVTAAETEATVAAGGLKTALLGLAGPIGIGLAVGPWVGQQVEKGLNSSNWLNDHVRNPVRNFFGADSIPDHKAGGGSIQGSGAKGKDSVPAWLAPGEHVLTADEVDAMGGQTNVYKFRKALHRAHGGDIYANASTSDGAFRHLLLGGDHRPRTARHFDQGGAVAPPIVQNADGTITSSNPSWAHLIQRESGGRNVRQGIVDSNSGGNEAEGYFQITPATWKGHGGAAFAPNPLAATAQQQAVIAARILQGNPTGSDWGAGLPGRESARGLLNGLGTQSNPIYTTRTREAADRANDHVKEIQERLAELKPDAKQSTKDRLNDELKYAKEDQARLNDKAMREGETGGYGSGGSSGGGKTQSQAEQFGSGLLSGAMSDLGFGNIFGGKSPLEWPLVKMFTGLAGVGLAAGNLWAANKLSGGGASPTGMAGVGGPVDGLNAGLMSGSNESVNGLGDVSSGLGNGQSSADAALGAMPGGGSGSNDLLSNLAKSDLLNIPKAIHDAQAGQGGGPKTLQGMLLPGQPGQPPITAVIPGAPGSPVMGLGPQMPRYTGGPQLVPSSVASTPQASNRGSLGVAGNTTVHNDNSINVQGNTLTDPNSLLGPMKEYSNASTYSRSAFGGLPATTGPGGG